MSSRPLKQCLRPSVHNPAVLMYLPTYLPNYLPNIGTRTPEMTSNPFQQYQYSPPIQSAILKLNLD